MNLTRRPRLRNSTQRSCARSSFSVKYACPDVGTRRLLISPSTQTAGNASSRRPLIRAVSSDTVKTARSRTGPIALTLPPPRGVGLLRLPLPSGERVLVRLLQGLDNPDEQALDVRQDIVVPEAKGSVAVGMPKPRARRIGLT